MNLIYKKLHILIFIFLFSYIAMGSENRTLIICIDGCNSTVVDYAYTPTVQALIDNSTFSTKVQLRGNAYPTSGWASLLTGAYSINHGVEKDSIWDDNKFDEYPLLFDRIRTETPEKKTRAVVCNEILYEIVQSADNFELLDDDDLVESAVLNYLNSDIETNLYFVEFEGVFEAGRTYGFDDARIEYVKAFQRIDERIGNFMQAIQNRPEYDNENWTIMLTSNHGGNIDGTYGGDSKSETTIPLIISGDGIDNRNLASGLSDAKPDKDNSIQFEPENTKDFRYVMIKKTGTKLEEMLDFTVEFKVYANDWTSDPSIIGDKDWGSGGNPGWTVARRGSAYKFNHASVKRSRIDLNGGGTIADGDWHHVAITFDPTGYCRMYTDGELSEEKPMSYIDDDEFKSPFDYLAIGNEGTLTYNNWKGIIDEVRIWDVPLSAETVIEYYKKDNIERLDHPNIDDLLAYYKMNETTEADGSKVYDHSGNDYHGTLVKGNRVYVAPLKLTDIHPTVIDQFGGSVQNEWKLNGDIVKNDVRFILGEEAANAISTVGSHYPNPIRSSELLNVIIPESFDQMSNVDLKVLDINGSIYQNKEVTLLGNGTYKLKTEGLKSGYYIYSIRSGNKYLLGKFQVR